MQEPILIPLKQAAALLNISYITLRSLIATGDIRATKIGSKRLYIQRDEIDAFIRRNTTGGVS